MRNRAHGLPLLIAKVDLWPIAGPENFEGTSVERVHGRSSN
jgi:hypothetical protein